MKTGMNIAAKVPNTACQTAAGIQRDRKPAAANPTWRTLSLGVGGGRAQAIQRKPTVSAPGDASEIEAEAVADQVMRMAEPAALGRAPLAIARKCSACEDEGQIQTRRNPEAHADAGLDSAAAVHAARQGGAALPGSLRGYFEPRFGHDFSGVRIHADGQAAQAARAVQARAYTYGSDIVFGPGEYAPATSQGKRLLAHELVHVVQQGGGTVPQGAAATGQSQGAKQGHGVRSQYG